MNGRLTPAAQRSPFHATTISITGMLLCVFAAMAVLVRVSRDPSGADLLEVTNSFHESLRDYGHDDVAVIAASFRQAASEADENRARTSRSVLSFPRNVGRTDYFATASEAEEADELSGQPLRPADVNGPVFSHLMTELQRYCVVSPAEDFGGQLALDLYSQIPQSDDGIRNAIERILKTCPKSNDSAGPSPAEIEIIVWALTPVTSALAAASQEASAIEQSLEKSFKAQPGAAIPIRSSGRIWTRPKSPRPLITVVVRSAER